MLGIPIVLWFHVYVAGFIAGAALVGAPLPSPLRSLGVFMMAAAALGALLAIEFVRCYDARRWRKWRVRGLRALRELTPHQWQARNVLPVPQWKVRSSDGCPNAVG
jgi:hypothetical protein